MSVGGWDLLNSFAATLQAHHKDLAIVLPMVFVAVLVIVFAIFHRRLPGIGQLIHHAATGHATPAFLLILLSSKQAALRAHISDAEFGLVGILALGASLYTIVLAWLGKE